MERIEWENDYVRANPEQKDRNLVQFVANEIQRQLLPHLKRFFSTFHIFFIKETDKLGFYIHGSHEKPIILLCIDAIKKACCQYDVDMYCAIESTIVHELAHAIQDGYDVYPSEEEAEVFAKQWYNSRTVDEFWDGFESPGFVEEKQEAVE